MRYTVEETRAFIQARSGIQEVDIPDGCIPIMASRGIGVFQVLYLKPIGEVPASIETPSNVDDLLAEQQATAADPDKEPEVYVSKKDREKAKKAEKVEVCQDCGCDPCDCVRDT